MNFGNFQNNRRLYSEIRVFFATYPYESFVFFHTFIFTNDKVTDSASFEYKEYSSSGTQLYLRSMHVNTCVYSSYCKE